MDDFKRKAATKERGNYATPPTPKDRKLNKRQRSRLKRELPQPPNLDQRGRMIPESYARWIAEELHWSWSGGHEGRLTDADWAQLLTEAAEACGRRT